MISITRSIMLWSSVDSNLVCLNQKCIKIVYQTERPKLKLKKKNDCKNHSIWSRVKICWIWLVEIQLKCRDLNKNDAGTDWLEILGTRWHFEERATRSCGPDPNVCAAAAVHGKEPDGRQSSHLHQSGRCHPRDQELYERCLQGGHHLLWVRQ